MWNVVLVTRPISTVWCLLEERNQALNDVALSPETLNLADCANFVDSRKCNIEIVSERANQITRYI